MDSLHNFNIYINILSSCAGSHGVHPVDAGERRQARDAFSASILQQFEFVMFEEVVRPAPSCQPVAFDGERQRCRPEQKESDVFGSGLFGPGLFASLS